MRGPAELAVRRGLPFDVALTQDIDTSKAAAGDAIRCELATPIQEGSRLVASVGTPVTARIVELRRIYGPPSSVSLGFQLESLYVDGAAWTLAARAKGVSLRLGSRRQPVRQFQTGDARRVTVAFPYPNGNILATNGLKTSWITGP